jgi:hypothetical protein
LTPVAFSYSGASVFTKKSSKPLMNELSWTTVSDLVAPFARQGVRAAAAPPARAVLRNWRRVVLMRPPPRSGRPIGTGSRLGTHRGS